MAGVDFGNTRTAIIVFAFVILSVIVLNRMIMRSTPSAPLPNRKNAEGDTTAPPKYAGRVFLPTHLLKARPAVQSKPSSFRPQPAKNSSKRSSDTPLDHPASRNDSNPGNSEGFPARRDQ